MECLLHVFIHVGCLCAMRSYNVYVLSGKLTIERTQKTCTVSYNHSMCAAFRTSNTVCLHYMQTSAVCPIIAISCAQGAMRSPNYHAQKQDVTIFVF